MPPPCPTVLAAVSGAASECDVALRPSQQQPVPPTPRTSWHLDGAILRLRRMGGTGFDDFVKEFEGYVNELSDQLRDTNVNEIMIAQGRAQMAFKLLRMFNDTYQVK